MNEKTIYNLAYKQVRNESDKGYWKTVGVLIHNQDENRLSIHLDMIPASGWNGWLSAFPKEDDNGTTSSQRSSANSINDDDFDDIPFN